MTLEAPRPLLGAGVKMKKIMAYLNNFLGKKLFYIENLTKLPELTVPMKGNCKILTYLKRRLTVYGLTRETSVIGVCVLRFRR